MLASRCKKEGNWVPLLHSLSVSDRFEKGRRAGPRPFYRFLFSSFNRRVDLVAASGFSIRFHRLPPAEQDGMGSAKQSLFSFHHFFFLVAFPSARMYNPRYATRHGLLEGLDPLGAKLRIMFDCVFAVWCIGLCVVHGATSEAFVALRESLESTPLTLL